MAAREFDPLQLDVSAFAKEGGVLDGCWPLAGFERLSDATLAAADAPLDDVHWHAHGERRATRGGEAQVWLHLNADATVAFECQRCLNPVRVALAVDRNFLFVHGEDAAAQLDAESDDDVLALSRSLDLHELAEDELLLAMPLVALHEVCPQPLAMPVDDAEVPAEEAPNPFAVLAALKRRQVN